MPFRILLIGAMLFVFSDPVFAASPFQQWLDDFFVQAAREGITRDTYVQAFAGVTEPDGEVLVKARYQPEFTLDVWDYLDARVNYRTVSAGRLMARIHRPTLAAVEQRFGVEQEVLLAIWSMESGYGMVLQQPDRLHYVPAALATLAFADPRRRNFARTQLIAALQILQSGDVDIAGLTGSWAGAMGHTQFIPTSYLAYAVDMDGNGRRDIWGSVPDALATAANLLKKNGWRTGRTWGYEVEGPKDAAAYAGKTMTLGQWQEKGFSRVGVQAFPRPEEKAEIKMPAGAEGPIFLMVRNFFVLKRYNNSDFYALAVGLLADQLAGLPGMVGKWPRPADSLSSTEKFRLQELLRDTGLYSGEIDGLIGAGTRQAIRRYQLREGLPVEGRPTRQVLEHLQR